MWMVPADMLEDDVFLALAGDVDGTSTSTSSEGWPTDAADRVYPLMAPQAAPLPRLTFQRVGTRPVPTLDHPPRGGLDLVRVQVDAWAGGPERAARLAAQVRGAMQAAPFKGRLQNQFSAYDATAGVYRVSQDFHCWARI